MSDQHNQSARKDGTQTEWERHGFASEAEMNQAVYLLENERSKQRTKRRQELYEAGFLTTDQFYNNR